jgi:hypothetical protein
MTITHPVIRYCLGLMVLIAVATTVLQGCSDSNHPTFVTGQTGTITGPVFHGESTIVGVDGYITFTDVSTGLVAQAPIYNISDDESFYTVSVPEGRYTAALTAGAAVVYLSSTTTGGSGLFEVEGTTVTVLEDTDVTGPVIGVTYVPEGE